MRKRGRWFGVLAILLCMCMLCACKGKEEEASQESTHVQTVALSSLDMSSYVRLGVYEGLTIALDSADASRGDAVFAAVMETSEILAYPEDQVAYYAEQQRAAYRYYAKQKGASYCVYGGSGAFTGNETSAGYNPGYVQKQICR